MATGGIMTNLTKKLGQRIQEIRKMRNLTQSQLAELVGLEVMTVSRIENGTQYPKPENLDKFSKILKVNVREIFDFGHYENKKELVQELTNVLKAASLKDLQFYKKVICSHIEFKS